GPLVDERYRPVLHLSCGVRLGPDISKLFQLERTLEGDPVADATTEEVDVFDLGESVGDRQVVVHLGDRNPDEPRKAEKATSELAPLVLLERAALAGKVKGE